MQTRRVGPGTLAAVVLWSSGCGRSDVLDVPLDGEITRGAEAVEPPVFAVECRLASEFDANAPGTVAIVSFALNVAALVEASVEFGLDTAYGMTAPVDLAKRESPLETHVAHRALLLGMKPARTYHYRIVAKDGTRSYVSDDYTVETGPPTELVGVARFDVRNEALRERGFIITSYLQNSASNIPFIVDADGEVVWWYTGGPDGVLRARMSADGKNMWMTVASNAGAALRRVSMDTLDAQTYGNTTGSHDITPVSGKLMAYIDYDEADCHSIFEIDPSGRTSEVFESTGWVDAETCHANALRYSSRRDLYTLSDWKHDIFAVTREGAVEWRLSELVSGGNAAWGGENHGHHLLDQSLLIFANRGGAEGGSAVIEYALDGREITRYTSEARSFFVGDVQRLPGGNTLVTYSVAGLIREVDAQGEPVLELRGSGSPFGYALWVKSLYEPTSDIDP